MLREPLDKSATWALAPSRAGTIHVVSYPKLRRVQVSWGTNASWLLQLCESEERKHLGHAARIQVPVTIARPSKVHRCILQRNIRHIQVWQFVAEGVEGGDTSLAQASPCSSKLGCWFFSARRFNLSIERVPELGDSIHQIQHQYRACSVRWLSS